MKSATPQIQVLDESVRTQIAAGQVVERPVSVLKELLENAVDAGATEVTIRLKKGGLQEIVVRDNGAGIPADQLVLAVTPHATSKITSLADVSALTSFGFRGEALASIRAAAALTLQSRTARQTTGAQLLADSDEVVPVGMAVGTRVVVTELFRSHPARQKFLRTAQVEYRHCIQYLEVFTIATPMVTLKVFHNDQLVLDCPAAAQLTRVRQVWGQEHADTALTFSHSAGLYTFSGFVCKPEVARESSQRQVIHINNRIVKHTKLAQQVKQAFSTLLAVKKQPSFFVSVQLPPELLDVNVDPKKERVSLAEEKLVLSELYTAVQKVLAEHNLAFGAQNTVRYPYQMDMGVAEYFHTQTKLWSLKDLENEQILQIDNTYLFTQTATGVLVVDQHAAHESILYAQLKATLEARKKSDHKQQLSPPLVLAVTRSEAAAIVEQSAVLTQLGIEYQLLEHTLQITGVAEYLQSADVVAVVREVIGALESEQSSEYSSEILHRTLAYVACRSAVKAGDALTQAERKNLLTKLEVTDDTYTCPHGRPVAVLLSAQELAHLFERS